MQEEKTRRSTIKTPNVTRKEKKNSPCYDPSISLWNTIIICGLSIICGLFEDFHN